MNSTDSLFCADVPDDQIAIVSSTEEVTYAELIAATNALAVALQTKDPIPGSNVAVCAVNSASTVLAILAIRAAGKTWVALNPENSSPEIHRVLEATLPATIMVDEAGDAAVNADSDVKILFSQFSGLVETYFGQKPERHPDSPVKTPGCSDSLPSAKDGARQQMVVHSPIDQELGMRIMSCLAEGGQLVLTEGL